MQPRLLNTSMSWARTKRSVAVASWPCKIQQALGGPVIVVVVGATVVVVVGRGAVQRTAERTSMICLRTEGSVAVVSRCCKIEQRLGPGIVGAVVVVVVGAVVVVVGPTVMLVLVVAASVPVTTKLLKSAMPGSKQSGPTPPVRLNRCWPGGTVNMKSGERLDGVIRERGAAAECSVP